MQSLGINFHLVGFRIVKFSNDDMVGNCMFLLVSLLLLLFFLLFFVPPPRLLLSEYPLLVAVDMALWVKRLVSKHGDLS